MLLYMAANLLKKKNSLEMKKSTGFSNTLRMEVLIGPTTYKTCLILFTTVTDTHLSLHPIIVCTPWDRCKNAYTTLSIIASILKMACIFCQ